MPRGVYDRKKIQVPPAPAPSAVSELESVEALFEDLKVTLQAKKAAYETAAARIADVLESFAPSPRVGRPPKTTA